MTRLPIDRAPIPAAALALLLAAGCASRHAPRPAPAPASVTVGAIAEAQPPSPEPALPPVAPEPIYRNPKIGVVYLRAHQDAAGRLFGPQVMYQVIDPGGWNIAAVGSGRGYLPSADLETPPGAESPYAVPAREAPPPPRSPLLDPAAAGQIVITGLMHPEDRIEAEAMARRQGSGCSAVFDDQAGWILLPGPEASRNADRQP